MLPIEAAPLLYREMTQIADHPQWSAKEKITALATLMERIFFEATRREQIAFSSLFARIGYAGHRYRFQSDTLRAVHLLRWTAKRIREGGEGFSNSLPWALRALAESVLVLTGSAIPQELIQAWGDADYPRAGDSGGDLGFAQKCRVVALEDDPEGRYFLARDAESPEKTVRVRYGLADRNENFMPTIQAIRKIFGFPVTLNLLEVDIDAAGDYRPRVIIVEPDYLIDVSAVSECFKDTGPEPYAYLVRKFLPQEITEPIFLGNIANFFLDRLLTEPTVEWQGLFQETFQFSPFTWASMSDAQVRSVAQKSQKHFIHLKSMASGGFIRENIDPADCILEPAFFSEQYGLQGRLDLFYRSEERGAIVELKSGSPFKPNSYGISRSHFTQTLLYDLLVRSVFGAAIDPAKYILYSGVDLNHLRFAPTVVSEQWEALQLRNQLTAIERLLTKIKPGEEEVQLFERLRAARGKGFLARDFEAFEKVYCALSPLEQKYFNAFAGFIAREQWLSKIGEEQAEAISGHAALWRNSLEEKQQAFCVLSHLAILENRADREDPEVIFAKTEKTNPLANFRVGDIAVLYPATDDSDTVLDHQVIKCTISALGRTEVRVQLRYRQHNLKPFETEGYWRLEPDMTDAGFTAMYRGLFEWASAPANKRRLLMGLNRPGHSASAGEVSEIERIARSKDYFLLWGPPGTGKTSVMLRDLAAWILNNTSDNLLLLAYTNRAVDEICGALDDLGGDIRERYLRIGGRHSTADRYQEQLVSLKLKGVGTRAELKALLESRRIFVSTVASFGQHEGLLRLKKFQRLVVDEASQILEPQLIGLLTRFDHFVLIGDHRQLPAVTVQSAESGAVADDNLREIGLTDLRDSYFERLFRRCEAWKAEENFGKLRCQGRMHQAVMDFPNRFFYGGLLDILPAAGTGEIRRQQRVLHYELPGGDAELEAILARERVLFLNAEIDDGLPGQKTNRYEAALIVRLIKAFQKIYAFNQLTWTPEKTLGVITPWRAQIAQIRSAMEEAGLNPDLFTIDTVERYQGGAREIIILSACVNRPAQLESLVSLSAEGVDRKLNVALTRAREHMIVVGNSTLLKKDERYAAFIEEYSTPLEKDA